MPVAVSGLHELQAALAKADKQTRLGVRRGLRQVAQPVQQGAQQLAMSSIRNMPRSPRWSKMRVGVTRDLVYVAPRQRGVKGRGYDSRRRGAGTGPPSFADLLMDRAMGPALDAHAGEIEARFEEFIDMVADDFNHGRNVMAQITVNARQYELVTLDELTLDEAIVVWEYAKVSLDQIPDLEGFHPGVIAALIHVSVARAEPGEPAKAIRAVVGKIKVADLQTVFVDISEEVEQLPPPDAPSSSSPSSATGAASSATGAPAPEPAGPNGSGSPGSAIGAISDPRISVP